MGLAANAIVDIVAAPPPARGSGAADNDGPSFQDHVDAGDQRHNEPPHPTDNTQTTSKPSAPPTAQTDSSTSTLQTPRDTPPKDQPQQADAHSPVLLQLIAAVSPGVLGAKVEQQTTSPQYSAIPSEQPDPIQTVVVATGQQTNTRAESNTRPALVKAKGAGAKTSESEAAAQPPQAQDLPPIAQDAQTPVTPATTTPTPPLDNSKSDLRAGTNAIEGVEGAAHRNATPKQQPVNTPAPVTADATISQQKPDAPQARGRDAAMPLAAADVVKQATQDFAPARSQAPPDSPPPAVAHPQLVEPLQQAAGDASAQRSAPVAAQVGGEIIRRFNGSDTRFQLRLDPPELGRVDVRLDVSRDHRVTAVISADSPQALSDLARGARDLQQALQSAGLDLADDGLRFDLSSNGQGNSFAQAQAQQDQPDHRAANISQTETSTAPEVPASRPLSIDSWRGSRVDLVA
ncbi:MAG: flagellar hook-length control protein FliK [Proteobacteria bacterium]|nr:flagellar hook-length control protein FliK [Pseudomonadota bacterium]